MDMKKDFQSIIIHYINEENVKFINKVLKRFGKAKII